MVPLLAQAQYGVGEGDAAQAHALANGFVNKNVLFMAKFTRAGVACNIITLDDNTSKAFTFTPKSFTFATIDIRPPKNSTLLIKFFGLAEGDQL